MALLVHKLKYDKGPLKTYLCRQGLYDIVKKYQLTLMSFGVWKGHVVHTV